MIVCVSCDEKESCAKASNTVEFNEIVVVFHIGNTLISLFCCWLQEMKKKKSMLTIVEGFHYLFAYKMKCRNLTLRQFYLLNRAARLCNTKTHTFYHACGSCQMKRQTLKIAEIETGSLNHS